MRAATLVLIVTLAARADIESVYSQAVQLTRSGNLGLALTLLTKAADSDPRNAKIQNMLGLVLMQLGRLTEAEDAYNRALQIAPDFVAARQNRAINSFTRGQYVVAKNEFEALAKLRRTDVVPHFFLGLLATQAANFPRAREQLVEAARLEPRNPKVLLALTKVYLMLGERRLAQDCVRQARSNSQLSESERFDLALLLSEFDLNNVAAEMFQELWLSHPSSYDVGFNLVLVRYRAGELDVALKVVEDLRARTKVTGELLNLQAWIYNKMGRFNLAEDSLRLAITTQPDNADHYLDLSMVLRKQGKRDSCVTVLTDGIQRATHRDRLLVQVGLLRQEEGNDQAAETCYREALNINIACEPAYIALANLLLVGDGQTEALQILEKSLPILPKAPLLRYYYGSALLDNDRGGDSAQLEKAAALLRKAVELDPLFARTYYKLGKLYVLKRDYRMAQRYFEMTCALDPKDANAYYQLSRMAERLGEHKRAFELTRIVGQLHQEARQNEQDKFEDVKRLTLSDRWSKGAGVDRSKY